MAMNGTAIESTSHFEMRATQIRGYVERRGWVDPNRQPTRHHPLPIRMFMEDWREQVEAWAYESLYTALASADPMLAFRAFAQGVEYVTRMRYEYHLPVSGLGDVLSVARNRMEELLLLGPRSIASRDEAFERAAHRTEPRGPTVEIVDRAGGRSCLGTQVAVDPAVQLGLHYPGFPCRTMRRSMWTVCPR